MSFATYDIKCHILHMTNKYDLCRFGLSWFEISVSITAIETSGLKCLTVKAGKKDFFMKFKILYLSKNWFRGLYSSKCNTNIRLSVFLY